MTNANASIAVRLGLERNVRLYPWYRFLINLLFWQAVWFLYFQETLSAAEAILLYAISDVVTTILEVPSGYLSDRIGRRTTLIWATVAMLLGCVILAVGQTFLVFAIGLSLVGMGMAFLSGTDTALLYESLEGTDRVDDVEDQEVRAWRFSFSGLAIAAVTGGFLSLISIPLTYAATACALAGALIIAFLFCEPPKAQAHTDWRAQERHRLQTLRVAITQPVLVWILVLSILMYAFSHIPFVFGQPFIAQALAPLELSDDVPWVSGIVTALMMITSLATSAIATQVRARLGLRGILLMAFGMQVLLAGALALTSSAFAIALLLLRKVPDSFSTPFILARIQPLLNNDSRATYISFRNLLGKLVFSGSLYLAAGASSDVGQMSYAQIATILSVYAVFGCVTWVTLAVASRRIQLEQ